MTLTPLNAISPIDGRYRDKTDILAGYFSEAALIRYRILVEVEYFIALCNLRLPQLKHFDKKKYDELRNIYINFDLKDAQSVKDIEKITNHDVKAVEYFVRKKFDEKGLGDFREFIHFGLTSQDVTNTAIPMTVRDAWQDVLEPFFSDLLTKLKALASEWKAVPMLAHTHGQPASPTTLGKEIYVFAERLENQLRLFETIPFSAKFGGATGNFNAHHVAYPEIDWIKFADEFVNNTLGLSRLKTTTQIEHYDNFAALCDNIKRINTILIDLNRDIWTYISMEYFRQKIKKGEVGSSTMPHKVNPIDFENSEGNLGVANALFEHLSAKLPISRLQRDLTDSTIIRNIGIPFAHTLIGLKSLDKGLSKLILNEEKIRKDLDDNWAVVAEAIQTILRRENYPDPYDALKNLTRTDRKIDKKTIQTFIDNLDIPAKVRKELKKITPENYTGIIGF
ncbi:MAG: adenylosuccinate lyase [Bacteroidetes bacterium]|nr:adenylosuccinate lyase [Bacteroidota bacterium]